ncbi:MAG: PAS domain S-box protein [Spirochaetes bacterium]|nr:PAS domain S-box protein [Spirochaetota bacterium]
MDTYSHKTKKELIKDLKALRDQVEMLMSNNPPQPGNAPQSSNTGDYRNVLDGIDDGYWEVDLEGNFTYCNEAMARILGYSRDEIITKNFRAYMDEKTSKLVYSHFNDVFKSKSDKQTVVYDIIRKDGTERTAEISTTLIRSSDGKPAGFRGILRDITERLRDMDLQESFNMMRKALGQTVQALSLALEVRDPYTAGHHRRVADLARAIASQLDINRDRIDGIRIAGSILDIGKISVPSEILSKPGSLTEIEFRLIKTHPQTGYDILKTIDFPWPVATAVYQHHERINGSGYPMGLTDKKIIMEAKILAVADVVEAMSAYRPYRRPIGIDQALDEIKKNRDILYSADVVDACLILFRDHGYQMKD